MPNRFRSDPRWIAARFAGICQDCRGPIKRGEMAFYYPNGKILYCRGSECGALRSREFEAARQDEEVTQGGD